MRASLGRAAFALRGQTVRTRVLWSLVALAAFAVAFAGLTAYLLQRASIDRDITSDLTLRTQAFLELAEGTDPATGAAWATAEDLMRTGVSQFVASPTESAIGHVAGIPRFVPATAGHLPLEEDDEFLDVATATAASEVGVQSVRTEEADYKYVSVPLLSPDGEVLATFTLATDQGARIAALNRTFGLYALAALAALGLVAAIAWFIVGRLLEPIRDLDRTAREITDTDLDRRVPVSGNDDLARLATTVNEMLERLQRAFDAQRQLLDDAGHELRTPLAVMRTHLELLEPRDEAQVSDSQAVMLDEVAMMSRLVDDLVVLAKSDRPEFVHPEAIKLAELTESTATRAQAFSDREVAMEGAASARFRGDPQRLTQAWMQFVANAVKFSAPGKPIAIGSEATGEPGDGEIRLWVRDQGKGVKPEDRERILERFQRVDESVEGAGLGLPIVAAIAAAHGGHVDLESAPGVGSLFSIVIPWEAP